jgi:cytochrome c556
MGYHETHLKPEFFQNMAKVGEIATTFTKEANELAKVAATGDKEAIKAQYGKVSQSCKACHENFRKEDH